MNSYEVLKKVVIENSFSNSWASAREEWVVEPKIEEDDALSTSCICGHPQLRYIYTIKNVQNGNILTPIGDVCIKQFHNSDMETEADALLKLYRLCQAVNTNEYITLDTTFFSRKFLKYLYEHNVFKPNVYNKENGFNDYKFLLAMFNKRSPKSERQESKVRALIKTEIIPFAEGLLR